MRLIFFIPRKNGFTLLELLVGTAVFAILMLLLLQLTSALASNVRRTDDGLSMDSEVRIVFDLMRRDLAQARIGTAQNVFRGESNRMFFVSSTPRLATNFVSDQRQVVYFLEGGSLYRTAIEPTIAHWTSGLWNPMTNAWWSRAELVDARPGGFAERLLTGVQPYFDEAGNRFELFTYIARGSGQAAPSPTGATNPPGGVVVAFELASPTARKRGVTNASESRSYRYDIELNLPPVYQP